jgi:hypothetical protein
VEKGKGVMSGSGYRELHRQGQGQKLPVRVPYSPEEA